MGTSGFSYKPWKGSFYPKTLPDQDMLGFYAQHFRSVEINHSFYRMPTEKALLAWAGSVPPGFRFALKANQRITHIKRLRGCEDLLKQFLGTASVLNDGDHLGPVLVQLPPNFKFDSAVLEEFLALRPTGFRFAFEARHPSWYAEETYALLRRHDTALCLAETEDQEPPDVLTAGFTYLRLRRESYTPAQLALWRKRMEAWTREGADVYGYLKHEDEGKAPEYARQLLGGAKPASPARRAPNATRAK